MMDWRTIRTTDELQIFQQKFSELTTSKRADIIEQMILDLDEFKMDQVNSEKEQKAIEREIKRPEREALYKKRRARRR